jgi:hypothetical protein
MAIFDYCFAEEVAEPEIEAFAAFVEQVQNEDTALCQSVNTGLRSGMIDRGVLLPSKERALIHFQRLVSNALGASWQHRSDQQLYGHGHANAHDD